MTDFKQRLRSRQLVSLVNADHACGGLALAVCRLGIDALMLDCEQGTPGFQDIEDMTRAAHLAGVPTLVRVPSPEPWTIERYLMRGVDGIVIPRLDTVAQVRQAVADVRYAVPRRFDQLSIVVQIETLAAVRALDEFLAVPEVDCFFVGPVDLAKSMGHEGDYGAAPVQRQLEEVVARIAAAGRAAGFLVRENDLAHWRRQGATMLYTHVDDFLAMGARHWHGLWRGVQP